MKDNIFELSLNELKNIALSFQNKIKQGLEEEKTQVQCIPTYINPNVNIQNGKALVLDLGGTNYRAAVVEFINGSPVIHPIDGYKKDLSVMKTSGYTRELLFKEISDFISQLDLEEGMPIGYCFSYPTQSLPDGDASLIRWTKGVDIHEMIGENVGKPLLDYLKNNNIGQFSSIKIINDTIASLFAGLSISGYDAQIGLIVGTGTNMATFVNTNNVKKINKNVVEGKFIPINLESGNFAPPHLTMIDDIVDVKSDILGSQIFEKAVSGMYLGEILKAVFPDTEFENKFDAQRLTQIISYPDIYKIEYVKVATSIYIRSANLVAASLTGLIMELKEQSPSIKKISITAEGSLFWSENRRGKNYKEIVSDELYLLLSSLGYNDLTIEINRIENANLIGAAFAAFG